MPFDGEIFSSRKDWAHGFWHLASGISEASITSSEIPKRAPFLKLFNVRISLFFCFEKRLTLNLEEKADRLKIFIRTNLRSGRILASLSYSLMLVAR